MTDPSVMSDIQSLFSFLNNLTTPDVPSRTLHDALASKVANCGVQVNSLPFLKDIDAVVDRQLLESLPGWQYVRIVFNCWLELNQLLKNGTEKERLLSVKQEQLLKKSIEIVISLSIIPYLPEGFGIGLRLRSSSDVSLFQPLASLKEKCSAIHFALCGLRVLYQESRFKEILVKSHMTDILAAICCLLLNSQREGPYPLDERELYKKWLEVLICNNPQPLIIRELMLLLGNKGCPPKLARFLRGILSDRLMQDSGVISTVRAILDIAGHDSSPKQWETIEILSKLIITTHIKEKDKYYSLICNQILSLLKSANMQYVQIGVGCLKLLLERDPMLCEKHFLSKIRTPLLIPSSEEDVASSVEVLYNCVAIPRPSHCSLPLSILNTVISSIFKLYVKVTGSAYFLKTKVEDIVWSFVSSPLADFSHLDYFIFNSLSSSSENLNFDFGPNGGVQCVKKENEISCEECGDVLLNLLEIKDKSSKVKHLLFKYLLSCYCQKETSLDKKLITTKMLSTLCSDPEVHQFIGSEPFFITGFIKTVLEDIVIDEDIICLGLMVLNIILNDRIQKKTTKWEEYDPLIEPLKNFKGRTKNSELKLLAENTHCLIATRGVTNGQMKNEGSDLCRTDEERNLGDARNTDLEEAMVEAVDGLLPVRAHGIRKLARLLCLKNKQALAKKDYLFCLFKENLKDEDSYLYLSAIEGLASLSSVFPDDVLMLLSEQFALSKDSQVRLKVGEVLMKVIQNLDEMVAVYKNEVINALLHGCKDPDPLVRTSSLSNIGELCRILSYRVGPLLVEIFHNIKNIYECDPEKEPRRASVMVLTLLLKGLGKEALVVLEPILLELYRKLKLVYDCEKDDLTRLHAQLALEELRSCTFSYLCPPENFEKKIYISQAPP